MNTLLIDSNYLCHKARYAIHKDLAYGDQSTKVIFGFLNDILKLHQLFETREFLFFWDSRKNNRKLIYPQYKTRAPRDPAEEEQFKSDMIQFVLLRTEILPKMGFANHFLSTGFESDDLMAKLVLSSSMQKWIIVSGDEDMYQLLDHCTVWQPGKKKLVTKKDLWDEYGVTPIQWIDVKMIGGCSSDTVGGIPGVAEKTACKFLRGELKTDSKTYLMITSPEGREIQERNRRLVTLPLEKTPLVSPVKDKLDAYGFRGICQDYGLKSYLSGDRWSEWVEFLGEK